MNLLCYTYDADHHCVNCTFEYVRTMELSKRDAARYSILELIDLEIARDSENNPIHAMLDNEEWYANDIYEGSTYAVLSCSDCGAQIDEWEA